MSNNDTKSLKAFIADAKRILARFEERMGWDPPDFENYNLVTCTVDKSHVVSSEKFEDHVERCRWRKLGYNADEVEEIVTHLKQSHVAGGKIDSEDIVLEYVNDKDVPIRRESVYKSKLAPETRALIYDRIINRIKQYDGTAHSVKTTDPNLFVDLVKEAKKKQSADTDEVKTDLALTKEMRDHKRRRQTYRAKNVHITKRTQTEIIRDVLAVHMEELRQQWGNTESDLPEQVNQSATIKTEPHHESSSSEKATAVQGTTTLRRSTDTTTEKDHLLTYRGRRDRDRSPRPTHYRRTSEYRRDDSHEERSRSRESRTSNRTRKEDSFNSRRYKSSERRSDTVDRSRSSSHRPSSDRHDSSYHKLKDPPRSNSENDSRSCGDNDESTYSSHKKKRKSSKKSSKKSKSHKKRHREDASDSESPKKKKKSKKSHKSVKTEGEIDIKTESL